MTIYIPQWVKSGGDDFTMEVEDQGFRIKQDCIEWIMGRGYTQQDINVWWKKDEEFDGSYFTILEVEVD